MDVGIFKASGARLKAWLIVPPLLIVSVGLGSHAWQQRARWRLQEAKALSEILPSFIMAQKEVAELFDSFKASGGSELGSGSQLISFLQDVAQKTDFVVDNVNMVNRKNQAQMDVPVLNAVVRGAGDFTAIEVYINKVKTEQRLLSVASIQIDSSEEHAADGQYEVEIVFELLLLDEMKTFSGGSK